MKSNILFLTIEEKQKIDHTIDALSAKLAGLITSLTM